MDECEAACDLLINVSDEAVSVSSVSEEKLKSCWL